MELIELKAFVFLTILILLLAAIAITVAIDFALIIGRGEKDENECVETIHDTMQKTKS
ncbi:hypothetical protein [Clostridium sp. YIM B02551]|uniref:hypothetical protein n=1 Tax=Clostridium sp. YIM B02551 TaxID=2910679 RepID=UPI001EEA90E8|nr:hypothetical protein [Clostridium sp. YIM B02551]